MFREYCWSLQAGDSRRFLLLCAPRLENLKETTVELAALTEKECNSQFVLSGV
jgi:hypothetical protein